MKIQSDNLSTTFKTKFSSSRSSFKPSLKSNSRNFSPNMDTNRGSEELYDEVVIYDGGDVNGYGYPEKED